MPNQGQYGYGGGPMGAGPSAGPQGNMYGWNSSGGGQNPSMMTQGKNLLYFDARQSTVETQSILITLNFVYFTIESSYSSDKVFDFSSIDCNSVYLVS